MTTCFSTPQDHDLDRGYMRDCAPTLSAASGNSGNNRPFIVRSVYSVDMGGAKAAAASYSTTHQPLTALIKENP